MTSGDGPQFFPNMSNALITNSTITNVNGNAYFNTSERHELELLHSKVSTTALHNSGERYDAPRCHPGTRVSIQEDIRRWLNDVDDPQFVFWIYGSAGVGKSAIAHAIATLCYDSEPRRLTGAFFLSRSAPAESGRGDAKNLVATLAYQMTTNIPNLEIHVSNAIARNRLVFTLDLETQIRELILNPLAILSENTSNRIPPMIFILDALDECSPTSSQARLVKAFIAATGKMQHNIPHKLLITSRPESHIKTVFAAPEISPVVRLISLDTNYNAHNDIRKFLVDGLTRFKETHPTPTIFPPIWPTECDIDMLVWRSSGQFIYASTAQQYIQEDHANPILRLQSILGVIKDSPNLPFAELDALYSHIFQQLKELETVLCIMFIGQCYTSSTITFSESLLGLLKGEGALALQGLSSVGKVDSDKFQAYHASLTDFLTDKIRSGDFYIYTDKICTHLCSLALEYIPPLLCCDEPDSATVQLSFCFSLATECVQQIGDPRSEIHKILSTFDLDALFHFFRTIKPGCKYDEKVFKECNKLIVWLFMEHQDLAQSNNMILLPLISQLQKWLLGQLKRFQFDEPPSRQSLDYWENIFLYQDGEMCLIQCGLFNSSWVTGSALQALSEDRITQLMSRYCFYILNSSWLNLIRNACLNLNSDILSKPHEEFDLWLWMDFFERHGTLQIDQYLDIQYILGLNSSLSTAASLNDFRELPHYGLMLLIPDLYQYLLKVEGEFSCLTSLSNKLEEGATAAEEQTMDRQLSLPYIPHPSDSPSFVLALTFHMVSHIEYRDTELLLPVQLSTG